MRELEYIQSNGISALNLGRWPANRTVEIEFAPLSCTTGTDGWQHFLNTDKTSIFHPYGGTNLDKLSFASTNGVYAYTLNNPTLDVYYKVVFTPDSISINGAQVVYAQTEMSSVIAWIGGERDDWWRSTIGKFKVIRVKDGSLTTVNEYHPYVNDDNVVGMLDVITNTFYSPSSSWVAGPFLHIFKSSSPYCRFDATGGTFSLTVTAETGWSATTPSWASFSTTTGESGTTTIIITAPNYTGDTKRQEIITFTDDDGYSFTFKLYQKGIGVSSSIYMGDENILSICLGETELSSIYLGDTQIYSN